MALTKTVVGINKDINGQIHQVMAVRGFDSVAAGSGILGNAESIGIDKPSILYGVSGVIAPSQDADLLIGASNSLNFAGVGVTGQELVLFEELNVVTTIKPQFFTGAPILSFKDIDTGLKSSNNLRLFFRFRNNDTSRIISGFSTIFVWLRELSAENVQRSMR